MLREIDHVKNVVGNTQATLEAKADESFRVKAIRVSTPSSNYMTVKVDRVTCAYIRVGGVQGNHAYFPQGVGKPPSLWEMLIINGIFRPIPVASGQTLTIEGVHQATSIVEIIYDIYDANDVQSSEPNGSSSDEYDYINYGRFTGTLAAGDNLYSVQQTTVQYPAFPFGKDAPAKSQTTLYGFAFSAIAKDSSAGTNQHRTDYVKFVRNRETLFDDDMNGFLYRGGTFTSNTTNVANGVQHAGNQSDADFIPPKIFDAPLEFSPGEDIDLYVNTTVVTGAANIAALDAEVALIQSIKRMQ